MKLLYGIIATATVALGVVVVWQNWAGLRRTLTFKGAPETTPPVEAF